MQFVIGYLVLLALAALAAVLPQLPTVRAGLLCAAASGLAVLGFLALEDIGAGLVLGAVFAVAALRRALESARPVPAILLCPLGTAVALGVLFGGFSLTS